MRLCLLLITALIFTPAPLRAQGDIPAQPQSTFNAESFTLSNGMQVVVIPNHRAPVVSHMIWYKVGAADEAPGRSGMAHYLEHLLFKGSKTLAPGEYSKTVRTLGGNDNAFTGYDFTAFYANVATKHLFKIMEMEADRMITANPPADHYASEKAVIIEERRQRTDNDPRARFAEQLKSLLYVNHPYGLPVIGWMNEMEKYEWVDVAEFYQKWYAPNNAILIVSGDITAAQLKPAAEMIYGKIKPRFIPPRTRPAVPPAPSPVRITMHDDTIQQPVYQRLSLAPAESRQKKDALALQVLQNILDGGAATRLYKSLVVDQKKAVQVGFSYSGTALDYGTISLYAIPAPGISLEEVETLMEAEIRKVIDNGVNAEEVAEAIARLQDEAIYARDSLTGPAMIFGYALSTGSSTQDVENWPADIAAVTPADVQRVAKTYLDRDNAWIRPPVTGYLLPAEKEESAE